MQKPDKTGRPADLTKEQHQTVLQYVKDYLNRTALADHPDNISCVVRLAVELAMKFDGVIGATGKDLGELDWRNYLRYHFSPLVKRSSSQREEATDRLTREGKIQPAMGIFMLKQLGWRDKQEIEHSGGQAIQITRRVVTEKQGDTTDD